MLSIGDLTCVTSEILYVLYAVSCHNMSFYLCIINSNHIVEENGKTTLVFRRAIAREYIGG